VSTAEGRTYRFAPLDRTGVLLGLDGPQCALLAAGVLGAGAAADVGPLVAGAALIAAGALAFGHWDGWPLRRHLPVAARYWGLRIWRRRRSTSAAAAGAWPWPLAGIEVLDAGPAGRWPAGPGVGVVADPRRHRVSASLVVAGTGYCLAAPAEQERLVAGWGDVLGGFCRERAGGIEVRVTELASPAAASPPAPPVAAGHTGTRRRALVSYRALLAEASKSSVGRQALVTVTLDTRRVGRSRTRPEPGTDPRRRAVAAREAVVPAWCGEDLTSLQFGLQIHARLTGKEREQVMVIDDDHAVAVYSSARSGSAAMTRSTASAYVPSRSNPPITTPTAGGIRSSTGEPSPGESSPTSAARRLARSTVASRS